MATFKLTNINLQIDKPLFHSHTAKILKIEVAEPNSTPSIIKLPQPPQILNAQSLQWHATLSLPARFGKPFQFEIINKHTGYGYNPQDTETAFEGRIVIKKSDGDYAGWEVTLDDQKIGFLFANIEVFSKLGSKQAITTIQSNKSAFFGNTIPVKKDHIAITSLYANFPQLSKIQKTRVFIEFQLSGSTSRSSIKRLHQAEYRSYETIQLPVVTAKNNKLVAAAFIFDSQGNATKKIGQGFTQLLIQSQNKESSSLAERLKIERVFLYNQNMEEVGWVSFKFLLTKDQLLDPKVFLQDHFNTIGDVNFRPLKNNSLTISQIRGTIPIMSGLESNSRVYVPKSQRFDDPSKRKACQKIGLGHVSLELKEYPSTHKYKVAGIGFGTKIVPVQRDTSIPGVGRYNLPLLFDRFK